MLRQNDLTVKRGKKTERRDNKHEGSTRRHKRGHKERRRVRFGSGGESKPLK